MTQWYEVTSPPSVSMAGNLTGRTWRVLVVDGRVAACSSYPHCPAAVGEGWAPLVEKWSTWVDWRVHKLSGDRVECAKPMKEIDDDPL
jgi:hypothetical protein